MKHTFLAVIFLLLLPDNSVFAQTTVYGNFKVEDQELVYQKIFLQDSVTLQKVADYFGKQSFVSNISSSGSDVEFDVNDFIIDYKKFGFSQVATPPVIQTGKFYGHVSISVKEGKYRVTMRSIEFTGDLGYKKIAAREKLTNYACRDNGTYISQDWTKPNTLGLFDKALTDKLQYVDPKNKKEGSEW